ILFGEQNLMRHVRRLWKSGGPDRFRGLVRAFEIARIPHRATRQDFCDRLEHLAIAAIALDVFLAVNVAAVAAHRRVTYPPPARGDNTGLVATGHPDDLHLLEHDLVGKPVSTFPDHALVSSYVRALAVSSGFAV